MYTRRGLVAACIALLLMAGTITLLLLGINTQPMYRPLAMLGAATTIVFCLFIMADFMIAGWFARREAEIQAQNQGGRR
jgi:hypothetical protein